MLPNAKLIRQHRDNSSHRGGVVALHRLHLIELFTANQNVIITKKKPSKKSAFWHLKFIENTSFNISPFLNDCCK